MIREGQNADLQIFIVQVTREFKHSLEVETRVVPAARVASEKPVKVS